MALDTIDREAKSALADRLWAASDELMRAVGALESSAVELAGTLESPVADAEADTVVIQGREVGRALRGLALRLDRCVAWRH